MIKFIVIVLYFQKFLIYPRVAMHTDTHTHKHVNTQSLQFVWRASHRLTCEIDRLSLYIYQSMPILSFSLTHKYYTSISGRPVKRPIYHTCLIFRLCSCEIKSFNEFLFHKLFNENACNFFFVFRYSKSFWLEEEKEREKVHCDWQAVF